MSIKKWIIEHQPHLLDNLEDSDSAVDHVVKQLEWADKQYPGGVANYVNRARELLKQSAAGLNPYAGFQVDVPKTCAPEIGSDEFYQIERLGLEEVKSCCFVLVAGGLGERLGYPDIKIGLATNMITKMTYAEYYFACINHFQRMAKKKLPLMIMTSGDTHAKTMALLESNNYFSLDKSQVTIIQQEKVPALSDNDGRIAFQDDPKTGLREIVLKPHGHGDVHTLIFQNKLAERWLNEHKMKWLLFFQDTNALTFKALPVLLGVSKDRNYHMNSLCIARTPGEAVGAICKLTGPSSQEEYTLNVEYNQLDSLLKAMGLAGDVAEPGKTVSPFPGNCNILLFNLEAYNAVLNKSKGSVPEFVNPKYADSSKTKFKSPTRVECMMQEFARLFDTSYNVGATVLPRWFCFSTVKNNIADAAPKMKKGLPGECAFSGEVELYDNNLRLLELAAKKCGVPFIVPKPPHQELSFHGMTLKVGPRIVLNPSYGLTVTEIAQRLKESKEIKIETVESSLVLEGAVTFSRIQLSGSLILSAGNEGGQTCVGHVVVKNPGTHFEQVDISDPSVPLMERVRGYKLTINQAQII